MASLQTRRGGPLRRPKPHLRYDKVVVWLIDHVRAAVGQLKPTGVTILLSVTAPIRLASKTAAEIGDDIGVLLQGRRGTREIGRTIHNNRICIRRIDIRSRSAPRLIGFVHNPETDPRPLFEMASAMLELFYGRRKTRAPKRLSGVRWLVLTTDDPSSHVSAYRDVFSQLSKPTGFDKVVVVFGDGQIETLGGSGVAPSRG